uniref:fibrinogen gamma chain-like n=1 Tax=Styela clava TaxID=7725 RepID=UPI00193A21AE|nr:fibrinogen gamma chain-like [Styela clava]
MEDSGGGWIVIQRRVDGSLDFNRTWEEYENGFGNISCNGEFWLGNKYLASIGLTGYQRSKIILTDWSGEYRVAQYSYFKVNQATHWYTLQISAFQEENSNVSDAMTSHFNQNNMRFTTADQDHIYSVLPTQCPRSPGGWWFNKCNSANLNGYYHQGSFSPSSQPGGIVWTTWKGPTYSLKYVSSISCPKMLRWRELYFLQILYLAQILLKNFCIAQVDNFEECTNIKWGELCPTEERLNFIYQSVDHDIRSEFEKLQNEISDAENRRNHLSERNRLPRKVDLREHVRSVAEDSRILETKLSDVRPITNGVSFVSTQADNNLHAVDSLIRRAELKISSLENDCARNALREHERREHENHCSFSTITGEDCAEIHRKGGRRDGVYYIQPKGVTKPIQVYCDMQDKGGGWTVIQRRFDGSLNFDRNWETFKWGFGQQVCDQESEYWLGNEFIHLLTTQNATEMKIDLTSWDDIERYALYRFFHVGDESTNYKLRVNGYFMDPNGGVGDAFGGSGVFCGNLSRVDEEQTQHKLMSFTTKDRDNDKHTENCAANSRGGWWYNQCVSANLNGQRGSADELPHLVNGDTDGMVWVTWKGCWESLKASKIKIRPFGFSPDDAPIRPTDAEIRRLLLNRSRIARRLLRRRWKRNPEKIYELAKALGLRR